MLTTGPSLASIDCAKRNRLGTASETRRNVQDADATLILIRGQLVGGSRLTKRIADELNKPVHVANLELDWHTQ